MSVRRVVAVGTVLLVALVFAPSCWGQMVALVRDTTPAEPSLTYRYLSRVEGTTFCYHGQSISLLNLTSHMTPLEEADTRAHEAMHREQHARAGGCEKFEKIYRTPKGMMESEAEAFHAGACVLIAAGGDAATIEATYVLRIYQTYLGGGTPIQEIVEAYRRYPCVSPP